MADVFVSYKAEDRRRVKPLVDALEAEGFSVWWDEQIGGGAAWRQTIEGELNSAKCVIVVWSKRSVGPEGTFVQDEATRAQQRHVYIPVLIDKVHLPLGFGETQALPLTGWRGAAADPRYQAVLAAVGRNAGAKRRGVRSALPNQPQMNRRALIAGGSAAVVGVAAVGTWTLLKPSSAGASSDSIAVLPFANLSGDPAQGYFSDGIAEEIRSALARVAGLKVVGRTSSEAVRNDDAESAAKRLGVANILAGSVRQSPSTMRITAELVDGRTGVDRWSQDYDRVPGDSIKIQTDIAENVANAMSSALGRAIRSAVSIGGTDNPEAQRLYIQAGAIAQQASAKADFEKSLTLLDSAIALDPQFADAYARKSALLSTFGNNYSIAVELAPNRAEALRLARKSLQIAPNLARGHLALYQVYSNLLQLGPSNAEINRARRLAPGDAEILSSLADNFGLIGNIDGGLSLAEQAIALDPLNPSPYFVRLDVLLAGRRFKEAAAYGEELQRKFPQRSIGDLRMADALVFLNRFGDAQAAYALAQADYWHRLTGEAILRIRSGDKAGGEQKLQRLRQVYGDAASTQFGEIYAQLGDMDRAFAALDRAYEIKDAGLLGLKIDPFLDPLRSDPRFTALLRKLNFPAL
jgi:TolB-like protein